MRSISVVVLFALCCAVVSSQSLQPAPKAQPTAVAPTSPQQKVAPPAPSAVVPPPPAQQKPVVNQKQQPPAPAQQQTAVTKPAAAVATPPPQPQQQAAVTKPAAVATPPPQPQQQAAVNKPAANQPQSTPNKQPAANAAKPPQKQQPQSKVAPAVNQPLRAAAVSGPVVRAEAPPAPLFPAALAFPTSNTSRWKVQSLVNKFTDTVVRGPLPYGTGICDIQAAAGTCCSPRIKTCCNSACMADVSPWQQLAPDVPGPWQSTRLPTDIIPSSYELDLQTDVESGNLLGQITIKADVLAPTKYVVLHSRHHNFTTVSVSIKNGSDFQWFVSLNAVYFYPNLDYAIIETSNILPVGSCTIHIGYLGRLAHDAVGFFRAPYTKPNGKQVFMASTHFEALYARRAFPCFDEPAMKATFDVILTVPKKRVALSNMPVASSIEVVPSFSTTDRPVSWKRVVFSTSVKMSSYLVAFSVCDFKYVEKQYTNNGVTFPVRVYAPPHLYKKGGYALNVALEVLKFYETRFGIPYALPKLDMIALPDFKTGSAAMENWGLITFTTTSLMYDPKRTSTAQKQSLTSTVTHELAHQWFGNLVTMKWWNDLWLNEGFATFADYTALSELRPKWRRMEALLLRTQRAFIMDSLDAARPIHVDVGGRLNEVNVLFDGISYSKGCAMVRMVQDFVSRNGNADVFYTGLRKYLNAFRFSNAEDVDLWSAISDVVKESGITLDIPAIMNTWTHQAGYPFVNVSLAANGQVAVSQARFSMASAGLNDTQANSWTIPVTYVTRKYPRWRRLHWLPIGTVSNSITLRAPPDVDADLSSEFVLLANVGRHGFYRVNYTPLHWDYLAALLKTRPTFFEAIDRSGLLDDAFEFGRAAVLEYPTILNLTQYLESERGYVPWVVSFEGFAYMRDRLVNSNVYNMLEKYVLSKLQPLLRTFGSFDKESFAKSDQQMKLLRALSFSAGVTYGDQVVRAQALEYWRTFHKDPKAGYAKIPSDIFTSVLRIAIETGGRYEFNYLWKLFRAPSTSFARKSSILVALSCSRSPWLLAKLLQVSLNRNIIRGGEALTIILAVSRNPIGAELVLEFVIKNYNNPAFQQLPLNSILNNALTRLDTPQRLQEFIDFFSVQSKTSGSRTFFQAQELIRANVRWSGRNEQAICLWLKAQGFNSNGSC